MNRDRNIIVIFNDDHGQWALPAYGNKDLHTPTLDYLAGTGVVMENAFTPTPVCSPARACFLTGRLASQHGLHDYIASGEDFDTRRWLDKEVTLPQLLQKSGYQVGLTGKWHLGNDIEPHPGFDSWFALSGDYPIGAKGRYRFSDDGKIVELDGYKSQIITDHAVRFLRQRDQERPFFLFVGHTATHSPWTDHPERLVEHYRAKEFSAVPEGASYPFGKQNLESAELRPCPDEREGLAQYYAAITSLDEAVGRLMDEVDAQGLTDSTLILYTSDHGLCCGHHGIWGKGNGTLPLNMVEESIRIPVIFNHPKVIPRANRRPEFTDHLDLFQTLADYCGVQPPDDGNDIYAGRSLLPMLTGQDLSEPWRAVQFGEYGNVRMIRDQRYKLVIYCADNYCRLFDLEDDPAEETDIAGMPEQAMRIEQMKAQLDAHFRRYEVKQNSGVRNGGPEKTNFTSPW